MIQIWNSFTGLEENIEFIPMRRLNQDALEYFFGSMRTSCGNNQNPSCSDFIIHFKKIACTCIFKSVVGANCEEDFNLLLSEQIENFTETDQNSGIYSKNNNNNKKHICIVFLQMTKI